jgi:AraC-like DNA-binding protein
MVVLDQVMRESEEWLAGGVDLVQTVGTPAGRATLRTRHLAHQDITRDAPERWTHPRTTVGRVFLSLGASVKIRIGRRWHEAKPGEFLLLPAGPGFAAEYGVGRVVCHLFTAEDAAGLPVWTGPGPFRLEAPKLAAATVDALAAPAPGVLDCVAQQTILHFLNNRWIELAMREAAWRNFAPLARRLAAEPPARWRVSALAAEMGCTGPALSKRFQRALGLPLKRYLRQLVVARAQRTLAEGAESISAVAEALGYEDTAYFHRLFKCETGMTARTWRRTARP